MFFKFVLFLSVFYLCSSQLPPVTVFQHIILQNNAQTLFIGNLDGFQDNFAGLNDQLSEWYINEINEMMGYAEINMDDVEFLLNFAFDDAIIDAFILALFFPATEISVCETNSCSNFVIVFTNNLKTEIIIQRKINHGTEINGAPIYTLNPNSSATYCYGQTTYGPDITYSFTNGCGGQVEIQQNYCLTSGSTPNIKNNKINCPNVIKKYSSSYDGSCGYVYIYFGNDGKQENKIYDILINKYRNKKIVYEERLENIKRNIIYHPIPLIKNMINKTNNNKNKDKIEKEL